MLTELASVPDGMPPSDGGTWGTSAFNGGEPNEASHDLFPDIWPACGAGAGGVGSWPMINISPYLLAFCTEEEMRDAFVRLVQEAAEYDLARRERGETGTNAATLARVLDRRLATIEEMRHRDFRTAFTFFEGYTQERQDETVLAKARAALRMEDAPKSHHNIVNRWLKYVYLKMWAEGLVIFPIHFKLGSSFRNGEIKEILPPVATCHVDNPQRDMAAFGLSLTLSSRWRTFDAIDLDEYGAFSLQVGEDLAKREVLGIRARNPYSPFTSALWTWHKAGEGNGFRYSEADIKGYLYWIDCARRGVTPLKPSEFIPDAVARRVGVRQGVKNRHVRRRAAAQVDLIEHDRQQDFKEAILSGEKSLHEVRFEAAADNVNGPDDILTYMRMLRAKGVPRNRDNPYPARMHVYPEAIWTTWNDLFERYFALRRRQGFEGTRAWDTFRLVYRDYLCCYLPWWNELHPGIEVAIPANPTEFKRFGYWVEGLPDGAAPLPLLDFYDETRHGRSRDVFNGFIADTHGFFEFCRGDALRLGLASFENPAVPMQDRKVARGARKTNKVPIPTAVLPFLLRYAYACEAFFLGLGKRSLAGGISTAERSLIRLKVWSSEELAPSDFGVEAAFDFDGRHYIVQDVPMLATWDERFVRNEGAGSRTAFLPQLSALRMVIAALETGIRFQGIQWLCRKTYASLAPANLDGAELVPLVVNTDKVQDRPWKTLVVRRAFDLLRREEAYQDLMADGFIDRVVHYEKRDHTRFAPVLPLFRGPQSEYPISDQSYASVWEKLMLSFAPWYERTVAGAEPLRMWHIEPDTDPVSRQPRVVMHVDGDEQRPCCPIKVRLKHTPHSARSTFITARSGILPIEVTGWLVGQTNTATTYHYTVESEREVGEKVLAAANTLWAPDPGNPVHIRADRVNSALRLSFEKDRRGTEAAFGLQSVSLLNEEAPDVDGIALLRSTPMAQVAFRETHICPVGEMCPSNVMDVIVEPRRCGLCPLAVKGVDHLPSISAKMRQLLEQVREGASLIERMRGRGEPVATIEEVQQRRRLDVMEYEGWRTSLLSLTARLDELGREPAEMFHVGMPDAVRLHLRMVTRDAGMAEFILQRIADSDGHAAFETPTLRAQAAQLRQRLLASSRALDAEVDLVDADPVRSFLSSLKVTLEAHGIAPTFDAALKAVRGSVGLAGPAPATQLPSPAET
ncbi:MAG TPA: hypothetical protein VIL09_07150 [Microvirga sp.]|jgi:hypothetical protein